MAFITDNFRLRVPSPSTRFADLGLELEQLGRDIDGVLADFDYNGTDPNAVLSRLVRAENRLRALESAPPPFYRAGSSAEREKTPPRPGDFWQDTDGDKFLWSRSPAGEWRRHTGFGQITGNSWGLVTPPVYAMTTTVSLPTVIGSNEAIAISPLHTSSVYAMIGARGVAARNATDTQVSVGRYQFGNRNAFAMSFYWEVVSE